MKQFKTNAKCQGCVAAIGQHLTPIAGEGSWKIDLTSPDKILTVTSDISEQEIINAVNAAGLKAEKI